MRVHVLALEGMFDTGLSGMLDTLAMANELAQQSGVPGGFDVELVGLRRRVRTQQRFMLPITHVSEAADPDWVIVPALGEKTPAALTEALQRRDVKDAQKQLTLWHEGGAKLAAVCTGTYVMAAAGLLDGQRATTSWWLGPDFRCRFPEVSLDESQMVVAQSQCATAGAALAHIDLALWLVRQYSPTLAQITSRYLLFDGRPSQSSYVMRDHLAHTDPVMERFEAWARANLAEFTMPEAARHAGVSERTLERRVRKALGRTPISYVRDLRVEQAIYLLETTDEGVEEIALAVGYQDGVTLRTLLREKAGLGIKAIRNRGR